MDKIKKSRIIKILSIFISISLLFSSSGAGPAYARGSSGRNVAPQSIFQPLQDHEIKALAMLEYVIVSGTHSGKIDVMDETNDRSAFSLGVDFGTEEVDIKFQFTRAVDHERSGVRLIPCTFEAGGRTTDYWCCIIKSPDEKTPYGFTFFTAREQKEKDFIERVKRARYAERLERLAISRAARSEKKHDEKIRHAILENKYVAITEDNYRLSISGIYAFLDIISPGLSRDFARLVTAGQLMIITEAREEYKMEEPHAGGRGIYLPDEPRYINADTVVHEIFAKAGFTHEECDKFQDIFRRFARCLTDEKIDSPRVLPPEMYLSPEEKGLVEEAGPAEFVDLTEKMLARDYSAEQGKLTGTLNILVVEPDEDCMRKLCQALESSGPHMRVTAARTLQEARARITESPPDMVITDIQLPDGRGTQLLSIDGEKTRFPVIVMGSHVDRRAARITSEVIKKGALDYVVKSDAAFNVMSDIVERALRAWHHVIRDEGTKQELGRRLAMEQALTQVSSVLMEQASPDFDQALAILGKTVGVNRVYIFQFNEDTSGIDNTYEWCGSATTPLIKDSQGLDPSIFARWLKKLNRDETVAVRDIDDLPENAAAEKEFLQVRGVRSLFVIPLRLNGDPIGFIGFDNTKECCEWAKKDIEIDRIHTAVRLISSEIRRRRTEKTLYESERKFKELFEESPIGIAILNSEGRLTEANRACFGLPFMPDSSEPIEKSNFLEDICVPSELLLKELYAGGPIKFETSFDFKVKVLADGACVRKEGKRTFIDCRITPLSLAAGGKGAGGYLVQMEDITERKELEIRLRNAYVELEGKTARLLQAERLSAVGENTAALVHEINNPASNIINLIDGILTRLYKGGVVEKEEIIRTLESTEQEIERIADITARFLGFARPTGPEKTACSVGDILRDVVEMRKAVMDVMGIRVKWELSEELLVIIAGSGRLKQAFLNIVMNAVSFMKDTPVRDLTLRAERAKDAEGRNIVRVSFEDTGPGIMEKDLGRIWEPFYTKRADGMGSGQGLAVVKDVAEEHGGRATVESQLGQGTTFVMEFPTAGQETDVIKFFAAEARKNIYGSLWHDINNAMGVIGYLEMMILDASNLPDALLSKLESINMDAGKVVDLTRHAQAMTEPDEFLNIVEIHIMRLLASAETFLRKTEGFAGEKWRQNFELVYDKGFRLAKEKIDDGKCLLSIADSFSRKPGPVKIEKVLEDVLSVFKRSKRFFPQDLIAFDKIDRLFHSRKDIFILGDEAAFKFALFNILIMGMKGTGLPVMELEPEEKRLEVTVDSNRRSGEIIISFQNNYWLFADSQLEETDLGYGEQGAAVLKWERESSNCLALAHRILTRFAGRIILDNGKDGAVIRMFMPYQSRAEDASVQDRFSAGTEEEEVFRSEPETIMEGRPNIIVADDEPLQRDIFKSMLEEEYNVWLARNGQEAFDLIEEAKKVGQEFDLAVFDVSMPPAKGSDIIDGLVLTRRVRQQGHGFPVLISTGHAVGDPRFMRLENEGLISGVMMKTLHMAEKMLKIGKALKTAIPRNAKAVELQMVSADKTALIYGPGFDKGSKKLRSLGFKGTIVHARDAHELKERLMSGEHFDIIINTTSEDLKELIKKLLSGLDNSTPIIDGLDDTHHLQDTLLHICA